LIVAGPLADSAGLHATFLALSLPMLVLGVVAVFLPALRDLDRPSTQDGFRWPPGTVITPGYTERICAHSERNSLHTHRFRTSHHAHLDEG